MNKQEAIKEAKERHEKTLKRIELAAQVDEKLKQILPEGWKTGYVLEWDGYLISKFDDEKSMGDLEFRVISSFLEKILGKENVKRKPWVVGDVVFCLLTEATYQKDGITLPIEVRLFQPKSCKIEYKEVTKKEAIVDPACLGIQEEALE